MILDCTGWKGRRPWPLVAVVLMTAPGATGRAVAFVAGRRGALSIETTGAKLMRLAQALEAMEVEYGIGEARHPH